jgi:AcrR family transcriptional regulator
VDLTAQLDQRRPKRADAARNFDALLAAARAAFTELGPGVALEDIARWANVGIATLYRNFPTRESLIDGAYAAEVDKACEYAAGMTPWGDLVAWVENFTNTLGSNGALVEMLVGPSVSASRSALWTAGASVLDRAVAAGAVSSKVEIDDLMRLVVGISSMFAADREQRDRVLGMMLDGIRAA